MGVRAGTMVLVSHMAAIMFATIMMVITIMIIINDYSNSNNNSIMITITILIFNSTPSLSLDSAALCVVP